MKKYKDFTKDNLIIMKAEINDVKGASKSLILKKRRFLRQNKKKKSLFYVNFQRCL
ncbi:hypothetical protein [Fibrobacter sp. UBA4297]|uniref:hypothetical protein n=1 Tax=Fibrobacter sp. UBA4297 TaxID=1946536 RepID=UPI0025C1B738|nr:hypothetical protein [Fibrobacter sp. UBA4297]